MKVMKIFLVFLVVLLGLSVMINSAYAQDPDMTLWQGKWFKAKATSTGWKHELNGGPEKKYSYNNSVYIRLGDLDTENKILPMAVCIYDPTVAEWVFIPLNINYMATDSIHFLGHIQEDIVGTMGTGTVGMTIHVVGKMKGSELASATFTTLGGYSTGNACQIGCEEDDLTKINFGEVKVNGKLIDSSKVPASLLSMFP